MALALIGLCNIAGFNLAGFWGGRYPKPILLSSLYIARHAVISIFLEFPLSVWSTYAIAMDMGILWLSIASPDQRHGGDLFRRGQYYADVGWRGVPVSLVGGVTGGWPGGYAYDSVGNYDGVWIITMGFSVVAAVLIVTIRERLVPRLSALSWLNTALLIWRWFISRNYQTASEPLAAGRLGSGACAHLRQAGRQADQMCQFSVVRRRNRSPQPWLRITSRGMMLLKAYST